MIKNKNLHPDARQRQISYYMDFDAEISNQYAIAHNSDCDIKILRIELAYITTTNGGSVVNFRVGTGASATLYANITPAGSTTAPATTTITPSSTALVPKGTALVISPASLTEGTNTGACACVVTYALIDKAAS